MKIAVICSGGDSPGMNSALLAIKKQLIANQIRK
ncbi:6-phosphofructokinase [Enterococcus faecium]|nr:6-phosphofructokinase [Enterococcus faecium]MCC9081957.1 6-phosphofructokinase [Enterococcus faecium]